MRPGMFAADVEARLREASDASDLGPDKRLETKIDLSPAGIRARLLEASDLLDACVALSAFRRPP